jgi:hypothetical protein
LDIDRDLLLDVKNLDYVNDMFEFNVDISKINQTIPIIVDGYNELKKSLLEGNINKATFDSNTQRFLYPNLLFLKATLEDMDKKTEILMAKNKTLYKSSILTIDWFLELFTHTERYPNNFEVKWRKELVRLQKDRLENVQKSQKEIFSRQKRTGS